MASLWPEGRGGMVWIVLYLFGGVFGALTGSLLAYGCTFHKRMSKTTFWTIQVMGAVLGFVFWPLSISLWLLMAILVE